MSFSGAQLGLLNKIADPPANRRKPRQFATVDMSPSPETPYTLDFCMWLHRAFDVLLDEIGDGTLRGTLASVGYAG